MITLGNLKTGQTKQLEGDVRVTKEDGHYTVIVPGKGAAHLRFLKEEREWRFVVDGHGDVEYHLPEGTTGKTAVEVLIANWPAAPEPTDTPAPAPAADDKPKDARESAIERIQKLLQAGNDPTLDAVVAEAYLAKAATLMAQHSVEAEELRRAEGGEAGEGDDEIIEWLFPINTKGGHAPHRVAAYHAVVRAFGAGAFFTRHRPKGQGYTAEQVHLHVIAQAGVVDKIKDFLAIMELAMERQAEEVSRRVSAATRAAGGHHSSGGCKARRGFMRGFGQGIADRLKQGTDSFAAEDSTGSKALVLADRRQQVEAYMALNHGDLKPARTLQYSSSAYAEGRERGRSFASPAINEPAAEREAVNA